MAGTGTGPLRARPRVLHVITLSEWGGAQACVLALARGMRDAFEICVACGAGGRLVQRLRQEGIRTVEIPALRRHPHPVADLVALWQLVRLMRDERFDLVHCHSTKAGLLGRIAARVAGVPAVLFTAHGWAFAGGWHPVVRALAVLAERVAARLATRIICVSEHDRQCALRAGVGVPAQVVVIRPGVEPTAWSLGDSATTRHLSQPCTVVTVSRLASPKDPLTLLDAWDAVPGGHRLLLVGDGPLRRVVEVRISRGGQAGRVQLLGTRDDIPALLRSADIFVLSSRWEGLPLAVVEAMMAGLPVVATAVGGIPETVLHGETGLLVPPGDAHALASALHRLLQDADLRRRMGEAGRRRAMACFTQQRMVDATVALYRQILPDGTGAGHRP
ncbi:MAG: glycosyltransferase family 4 protein [Firmicutes bacterium]|nr:glycosyltransferase family 4 protein [Bacillota bacterium]